MFIRESGAVIALSMFTWIFTPSFDVNAPITEIIYMNEINTITYFSLPLF